MSRGRITLHQSEVWCLYSHRYDRTQRPVSVDELGSRGAVAHLVSKGWLVVEDRPGPRGGEHLYASPAPALRAICFHTRDHCGVRTGEVCKAAPRRPR